MVARPTAARPAGEPPWGYHDDLGITRRHMAVNIRKFMLQAHSLDGLLALGMLIAQTARFLEAAVVSSLNVPVAGRMTMSG